MGFLVLGIEELLDFEFSGDGFGTSLNSQISSKTKSYSISPFMKLLAIST